MYSCLASRWHAGATANYRGCFLRHTTQRSIVQELKLLQSQNGACPHSFQVTWFLVNQNSVMQLAFVYTAKNISSPCVSLDNHRKEKSITSFCQCNTFVADDSKPLTLIMKGFSSCVGNRGYIYYVTVFYTAYSLFPPSPYIRWNLKENSFHCIGLSFTQIYIFCFIEQGSSAAQISLPKEKINHNV